ncbi:Imm74 family immunity protein [Pandoraea pulmonicola]|uniref:Imm74 family immunity protein n=1 Tax=Pandoraea pulmonicola TaxID=93221 RepID=UPI0009327DEF|nr:Imm74 family immunity protein [Pandoraea pulmonicola]
MVVEVSRGHISVKLMGRVVTVQGEMFFPGGDKIGFVVYSDAIKTWDSPNQDIEITSSEKKLILEEIKCEFSSGGHTIEVE